jgi:hypothetical protein
MRITGDKKLKRQFRQMPKTVETRLQKSVKRHTEATARLARSLVPVASGQLKGWIYTQYEYGGLKASVEAAPPTQDAQIKAKSVEGGATRKNRGSTEPSPYMNIAKKHTAKKFQRSIKSAIKKGLKEATNG